jgi:predicted ATPase
MAQLKRGLELVAGLSATPALRRAEIKLQVALISPLIHVKGYAAPETKAAAERARFLIEQAEALGQPPDDPLLLFSVLYSFWVANVVAFNGDAVRELATQFLEFAEKQSATAPLMVGHRLLATSLLCTGDIEGGRTHYDQALALYDPDVHRPLATRFGQDVRVTILCFRSLPQWTLGYPEAALADADFSMRDASEVGQAGSLMTAFSVSSMTHVLCGKYANASALSEELASLADEKDAALWQSWAMMIHRCVLSLTGNASDAADKITAGYTKYRSTGSTLWTPFWLVHLARAHIELGQFADAWRCINDAMTAVETTKETWLEAEVHRVAGEIALALPDPDAFKAESCLKQALAVASLQKAKSWELRATMSMARLWRDQGKRDEARELLAPVYGWFTEGFDTLDLREAKALLDELAS